MQRRLLSCAARNLLRRHQSLLSHRAPAQLCRSLSTTSSSRTELAEKIENVYSRLMNTDWVDRDELNDVLYEEAQNAIVDFRRYYNNSGSRQNELTDLYEQVRKLFTAKEVAQLCDNYAECFQAMFREYSDATGILGNNTRALTTDEEGKLIAALHEYIDFMKSIEDKDIVEKAKQELGQKAIVLRQVVSAENFSMQVAPVAGDHLNF